MAFTAEQATHFLKAAYERNRLPHAILIVDPGKKGGETIAGNMVSLLNKGPVPPSGLPEDEYCRVLRPRSKSRRILIDEIREIEPFFQRRAQEGKWKIGIFPEADCINEQAANAFLKTLEEPPDHTLILLMTTSPDRLLPTILSRCVRVDLFTPGAGYDWKAIEKLILPPWKTMCESIGSEVAVLAFRGEMTRVLGIVREEISHRMETALKEASRQVAQGTGITDWEKQMQDSNAAAIESEYLSERDQLLDFLTSWLGDALMRKSGAEHCQFPEFEADTAKLAEKESIASLIRRIEALQRLKEDLKTNVHETLALDVRLLEALG